MKILLLTQFFSPTTGGGELLFSNIAKALADDGNKVWIITNRIRDESYPPHNNITIAFVSSPLEHKRGNPNTFKENIIYSFRTIIKALSIIRNEKIDIIHSNNFAPAFSGSILSFLTSKPHITVIHDIFSLYKNYWKLERKQKDTSTLNTLIGPIFEKMITKLKCSAIHTVSEASKDDLLAFGAKKPIYVIQNAIYVDEPKKYKTVPLQFICIGRLVFYKNLEVAIRAISILKKKYPKITLIIVGGGPHKENLEKLVTDLQLQNNVKFKGQASQQEKERCLSTSLAMVFPSLCEGFGMVILEAFKHRKPVLVSDVRPPSDIIEHEKTGFIIPAHDENEWAKALERIITEPDETRTMGEAGQKVLEEKYNVKMMKDKIVKMYDELIKK